MPYAIEQTNNHYVLTTPNRRLFVRKDQLLSPTLLWTKNCVICQLIDTLA